ncbi:MAG: NUDIX domain-containing protein [Gammaproteobacteria bacterium]|nr:NUDIX domain-containing protein [Gammaproteobacteria bacterium]
MTVELVSIVDECDSVIGEKPRTQVDYANDIYRVSNLWMTNSDGQILLGKRSLAKEKDPGCWGAAVSGTVESNETYHSNIVKEVEEEIGLTGLSLKTGPKQFVNLERRFHIQWFLVDKDVSPDDLVVQEEEVDRVEWFEPEALERDIKTAPERFQIYMPTAVKLLMS